MSRALGHLQVTASGRCRPLPPIPDSLRIRRRLPRILAPRSVCPSDPSTRPMLPSLAPLSPLSPNVASSSFCHLSALSLVQSPSQPIPCLPALSYSHPPAPRRLSYLSHPHARTTITISFHRTIVITRPSLSDIVLIAIRALMGRACIFRIFVECLCPIYIYRCFLGSSWASSAYYNVRISRRHGLMSDRFISMSDSLPPSPTHLIDISHLPQTLNI